MPPRPRPAKPRKVAATPEVDMMVSSDESDVDDVARDPNWQRTPLFKRISKITVRHAIGRHETDAWGQLSVFPSLWI